MGSAEGTAGLGDFLLVGELLGPVLPFVRSRDAVVFAEPAAQVDGLAPPAAEGKLRPCGRALPLHPALANRAAYPNHRKLSPSTWHFSSTFFPRRPNSACSARRPCRIWRPCRCCRPRSRPAWSPPGPSWRP